LSKVASAALLLPVSEALGQLKWSWFQGGKSQKMWDFEIFDNASRGPWGSLLLLVRTRGKSLAALGAAVTLFSLALDPFFQQVVEYPEHWRMQPNSNGSIPRANGYLPFQYGKEFQDGQETLELDQGLLGILNRYAYDNGTLPVIFGKGVRAEIPLSCPNSNCTWPAYDTLAMCNQCADASDRLEFKCLNTTLDWVQVPDEDSDSLTVYPNGTSCGWYLKADSPLLMTGYNVDHDTAHTGELLVERAQPLYDVMSREFLPGYNPVLNISRNPLAHAVIVSGGSYENVQNNGTPVAVHECVISWCIKTVESIYSEGGYTEKVIKTVVNDTVGPSPWQIDKIFDSSGNSLGTEYTYRENVSLESNGDTYFIDNQTHTLTLSLFDDVFPSTYTVANSTSMDDAILRYKQYKLRDPMSRNMTHNPLLYNNISAHFDNMVVAMTNILRTSNTKTEMFMGPAFDMENFVDVRWAWLVLPLGLLGMTFMFLVLTVVRSSVEQEHVGVWKTSAIATLLYGLPDEMQKKITASKEKGTPRMKAKQVKVRWLPKGGWRLSGTSAFTSPTSRKSRPPNTPEPEWI
jgi:hypothetical protein